MKRLMLIATMFVCLSSGTFAQSYGDYAVTVDVSGNGFAHYTTVYFDDESWDPQNPPTFGWDPCCDALMIWANTNQPHVFTEVVEPPLPPTNHRLSINGMPHIMQHTEVPLGFLPGELAQYEFAFSELYTLPTGMGLELEDLALNITQDLLIDSTYETWGAPSDDEGRFILHFYPETITSADSPLSDGNPQIGIDIANGILTLAPLGLVDQTFELQVIDFCGREVFRSASLRGNQCLSISEMKLSGGVYVFTTITSDRVVSHRKAVVY